MSNGANVVRVAPRKCDVEGGCGDMATCCEIRVAGDRSIMVHWTCECMTWTETFELCNQHVSVDLRDV